jgi:hypothetical protein
LNGSSFSPGADTPGEKSGLSPVSAPIGHGEEREETNRRSDTAPAADTQLAAKTENLPRKLAAALARNNESERRAEEDRMENERLAVEKRQNRDLGRENNELRRVKKELPRQNDEFTQEKDD